MRVKSIWNMEKGLLKNLKWFQSNQDRTWQKHSQSSSRWPAWTQSSFVQCLQRGSRKSFWCRWDKNRNVIHFITFWQINEIFHLPCALNLQKFFYIDCEIAAAVRCAGNGEHNGCFQVSFPIPMRLWNWIFPRCRFIPI